MVPHGWVECYLHPLGFASSCTRIVMARGKIEDFHYVPNLGFHSIVVLMEIISLRIPCIVTDDHMYNFMAVYYESCTLVKDRVISL